MIWPFAKKAPRNSLQVLPFKNGEAFIEYQCKFGNTKIQKNNGIFGVVIDAKEKFGTTATVDIDANGIQTALLRIASEDGGFVVISKTASNGGEKLHVGDVVVWVPVQHLPEMAQISDDSRFGWIGFIVAKVKPEIDMRENYPSIICNY